jgi:hypothetical protein
MILRLPPPAATLVQQMALQIRVRMCDPPGHSYCSQTATTGRCGHLSTMPAAFVGDDGSCFSGVRCE